MTTRNELVFNKVKIQPNADVTGTGTKFLTDVDPSLTGNLTLVGSAPTAPNHAVTKQYADAIVSGLDVKDSVKVATTANITLSGPQTIDGVSAIAGDRVLVKDQSDPTQNGIYVVAAGAWSRSDDADNTPFNEVSGGMFTFVEAGTVNADYGFVLNSITGNAVLGTDSLLFTQFSGAGSITAGDGLLATGNVFSVRVDDSSIEINADILRIKTTWIGQTAITTLGTITTGTWNGSTIDVAHGGTGAVSLTGVVIGNGTSAFTAVPGTPNTLIKFTSGSVANSSITDDGTDVKVGTLFDILVSSGTITAGVWAGTVIAANHGGTGFTSYTLGDTLYADTTSTLAKLAGNITTAVQVLSQTGTGSVSAAPVWLTLSTDNVVEGSNLYYTQGRFDTAFGLKTTDDLTEGVTNLYFTTARARLSLSGASNRISYNNTTGVIDIDAAYVGQTSITTTGTMTVGKISTGYKIGGVTMELGSDATGDLYYNNAGVLTRRAIGATNDFLKVVGGVPTWEALSSTNVTTALGFTPVNVAGDTMTGFLTLNANPTSALHAATKQYVDALATGLDFKNSVRAATTVADGNINLSTGGLLTIDTNVVLADGNRVLVKNQTLPEENGIYVVHSGSWLRAEDANDNLEVTSGMYMYVSEGLSLSSTAWVLTTNDSIILGTTGLNFAQFSGAGTYTAGSGLTLLSGVFSVTTNGITNAMIRQSSGLSVVGRSASSTGNVADITGTTDQVLRVDGAGTTLGFGTIATGGITNNAVTLAKIQQIATGTVLGRSTAATGDVEVLSTLPTTVQGNITSLGTITSGTWNGTTIAVANGGTGQITFTDGIMISASNVLSTVAGTANTMVKFGAAGITLADSSMTDNGTTVAINSTKFTVTVANGNTHVDGTLEVVGYATHTSGLTLNTNNDPSTVGNVATWIKITKTYADLAAAALTNNVTLLTLPSGCVVHMIKTIHTIAFTGGAISAYTVAVGITGTPGKYTSAFDVFQAASGTNQQLTTVNETENNSGTTTVQVNAASVGANLDVATAGSVDFYVLMSKANS